MISAKGFAYHLLQDGMDSDYHSHDTVEQIYYITEGRGKMKIDDEIYASPILIEDRLYLRGATHLYCISDD